MKNERTSNYDFEKKNNFIENFKKETKITPEITLVEKANKM